MSLNFLAGSEEYKSLRKLTYSNTDMVLMCFSIDSPDSLENIEKRWMPEVEQFCPTGLLSQSLLTRFLCT